MEAATGADPDRFVEVRGGLATIGPAGVALRTGLESRFVRWADECGAEPAIYPPLMRVAALDRLDYFKNFPHLGVMSTGIRREAIEREYAAGEGDVASIPAADLEPAEFALPSAACFNVYLSLAGRTLEAPYRVTTSANCFRRETSFDQNRLLGFYMREIVCVGEQDAVLAHLADFKRRITEFAVALELPLALEPSADPFFDAGGSRALMSKLFPTKEEFIYRRDGLEVAIGSLNYHRNFFGERCGILLPDGSAAFSGCVAFGLERWTNVMAAHFDEQADGLCGRIASA
jgi:seryl-tRNA synthetase